MKAKLHLPNGSRGFARHMAAPLARISSHRHEELEVNLVLAGSATYLFGRERAPLVPGSMIWLFPGQEHVLVDFSHDLSLWVLVFRQDLVREFSASATRAPLLLDDPGSIFCRQLNAPTVTRLNTIFQSASIDTEDQEFANAALPHAMVAAWQAYQFSREPVVFTDVHPAVAKAARLISESEEPPRLAELSRRAGLSVARLSRLFKQQTGTSLTAFRQRHCLERFFRIYRTGARYSLIEAALLAGFGSYPQFHRVFQQQIGQSPARYFRELPKRN